MYGHMISDKNIYISANDEYSPIGCWDFQNGDRHTGARIKMRLNYITG